MATSGSYDFSLNAAQIIARAAKNLGVVESGGTLNSSIETDLLQILNIIAKQFQGTADGTPGMKVHTRQRVTLFVAKGQQTYLIGPATTDARATTQYGHTTISAAEAAGQTTLSITAITDTTTYPGTTVTMTAADIIGIEQNDGTIFWSTISSTGAGPTVVIVNALDVAAGAGKNVWWFTARAQRFPILESAVMLDTSNNSTPIDVYSEVRQYDLGVSAKFADGSPTALLFEPLRLNTRITLNSQPTDVTRPLLLTVLYPQEDYDATTNDIAFPQEWLGYLEWELTLRACPQFQKVWTKEMQLNHTNAATIARNLNPENSVLYFRPG